MSDERLSIPIDAEVIVQIAFRIRRDKFALNHGVFEKYALRTPEELDAAVEAFRDALWAGTLKTVRLVGAA